GEAENAVRAVFEWDISAEAGVIDSISPRALNLIALAGMVIAAGYAVFPLARRFYHKLDLSPGSVTVALGTSALTVVVVIAAGFAIEQSQKQYALTINPPPQV